jgi:DNA-binding MarR family transcriptional regulator
MNAPRVVTRGAGTRGAGTRGAGTPGAGTPAGRAAPGGLGCGDALSDDLGWALRVLLRAYQKTVSSAFADIPGGPRGYQVLAAVGRANPRTQLELANHLGLDRTVMTYLLDDLEGAGLIERRPDPADRRARRIVATQAGRELGCGLARRLRDAEELVLGGLEDPGERESFRGLLERLATHVNTLDPVPGACELAREVGEPPVTGGPA